MKQALKDSRTARLGRLAERNEGMRCLIRALAEAESGRSDMAGAWAILGAIHLRNAAPDDTQVVLERMVAAAEQGDGQ